jgi:CDP-diacylglycerol--serine O-phosphatidyltransferase
MGGTVRFGNQEPNTRAGSGLFIVQLNPACWITLAGALSSATAILVFAGILESGPGPGFFLGAAVMFLGLLFDALDGIVARRFGWESELGKHLDGLADVLTFLAAPALALRALGGTSLAVSAALLCMIAAGLSRLARFAQIGNVQSQDGRKAYLGLPCYWSHFLVAGLCVVHRLMPAAGFQGLTAASVLFMSFLFVWSRTYRKPTRLWRILAIIGSLIGGALLLFVLRVTP